MLSMAAMAARYMYLIFLLIFMAAGAYIYKRGGSAGGSREMGRYQTAAWILLNLTSCVLWYLRAQEQKDFSGFWLSVGLYGGVLLLLWLEGRLICKNQARLLWNCVLMLVSIGMTVLWRLDPEGARRQLVWLYVCAAVTGGVSLVSRGGWFWKIPAWLYFAAGAVLLLLPFAFPLAAGGALNWTDIGGIHFQPSELVKLCWAFYLAVLYSREKRVLSVGRALAAYALVALVLLKQNDLGALLIFGVLLWLMTFLYGKKNYILWGGAAAALLAAVAAYFLVGHVRVRFDAWLDPWKDVTGGGYQIAQSLFAIAGGGWLGAGLYQGQPGYIPERTTDMIFAAITEEFGVLFSILLAGLYLLMVLTAFRGAEREKKPVRRNIFIALGLLLGTQSFLIMAGSIKLLPLTGVTLPFISYGGSSLLSSFILAGVLQQLLGSQTEEGGKSRVKKEKPIEEFRFEEPF